MNEYILKDTLFTALYGLEGRNWVIVDRIGPIGTYPLIDLKEIGFFDSGTGDCIYAICNQYVELSAYHDDNFEQVWFDCHPTAIAENIKEKEIEVYPNPTTGVVHIEGISVSEILVYNSLGNRVKVIQNTNVFNTGCLPQGLYMLKIIDNKNASFTTKIIVE